MYSQRPIRQTIYITDESGYCYKVSNIVLCVFLWILSIGLLGFGIWLVAWKDDFNYISVVLNYDIFRAGSILFIISSILLIIVSFIGVSGSSEEKSGLLLAFVIVGIVCEIMLIAITVMGMVFNQNFNNVFQTNLTYAIQFVYGVNLHIPRNVEVTNAIDQIQRKFACCGVIGDITSSTSWELYKSSSWIITQTTQFGPPYVPTSCCVMDAQQQPSNSRFCQGFNNNPAMPPIINNGIENVYLNSQGCISKMSADVSYFSMVMFGLALASAIYLLIVLIISFCVLRRVEVSKKQMEMNNEKFDPSKVEYAHNPKQKNQAKTNVFDSSKSLQESPSTSTYDDSRKILK